MTIISEFDGKWIDDPAIEPFWNEVCKLGMFVFVHPALKLNHAQQFDAYDTARAVGREFSLIMATIRLVNSGVFDRHPELTVHVAHLSGGIAGMLARIRCFQDKDFGAPPATSGTARKAPRTSTTISRTIWYSTPPALPAASARSKRAWLKFRRRNRFRHRLSAGNPQARGGARFVRDIRALGTDGEAILSGNVGLLLKEPPLKTHA